MRIFAIAVIAAAATAAAALAAPPGTTLQVGHAWARATPPGAPVAAAYLVIDNRGGKPDRLLAVSSPRAARVEVHSTVHEGGIAKMRRIDPLHVAAGERLSFEPGGIHVMLLDLASPLVAAERVPLALRFEIAGEMNIEAAVLAVGDAEPAHKHH